MQDMYANSNEEKKNSKKKNFHFKPVTYICCRFDIWHT